MEMREDFPHRQAAWDEASVERFVYDGVYTSKNWLFLLHVGRMYPTQRMSSTNEHVCTCILKMTGKVHILYELSGTKLSSLFNSENVRSFRASVVQKRGIEVLSIISGDRRLSTLDACYVSFTPQVAKIWADEWGQCVHVQREWNWLSMLL